MAMTTSRPYDTAPVDPLSESLGARVARTTFGVLGLGALGAATFVAAALWLLLTDPVTAGHVADADEMFPVVQALVLAVGKVVLSILAYL